MLFPYKYVSHQMEKMQEFIDFIFHNVWCKAPCSGPFRLELFDGNADLKGVMTLFQVGDTQAGDFFYGHVDRIYGHFSALSSAQIDQLRLWYQANNDLKMVCANDPQSSIARYADIAAVHKDLSKELGMFFKSLYSHLGAAPLKVHVGDMGDHYEAFMQGNSLGKCPFCGMADMQSVYHSKREAYDHYLPKALYPFNSVNCINLVPTCHHCNSSYKSTKDPAYTPKDPTQAVSRRKVFYPYANDGHRIVVKIELKKPDVEHLSPDDIDLEFGPPELSEEIDTWKDVYGIEERYKAKCCSGDAKDWIEQVRILKEQHKLDPEETIKTLSKQASISPFANANFFKIAFLEGCHRKGIFGAMGE